MKRGQLYAQLVDKKELKDEIKALFGKPFTNVSTSELENFLNSKKEAARHKKPTSKSQPKKKDCKCVSGTDRDLDMSYKMPANSKTQFAIASIAIKLEKLINMLSKRGILLEEELNELNEFYMVF